MANIVITANTASKESISYCDETEDLHPYVPDDVTLLKSNLNRRKIWGTQEGNEFEKPKQFIMDVESQQQ